mgnify:CR=1 FL=1
MAERDEVLEWMDSTKSGPSATAEHFGISRNTIKKWVQRRAPGPKYVPGIRLPSLKGGRTKADKSGETPEKPSAATLATLARARALTDKLGPRIRDSLRISVENLVNYIESETTRAAQACPTDLDELALWRLSRPKMHDVNQATKALDMLLKRVSELIEFDTKTSDDADARMGGAGAAGGAADTGRLAAALQLVRPGDEEESGASAVPLQAG